MSRKNSVIGKCHICGVTAKLSFEHVPPKKAYNNKRVREIKFDSHTLSLGPDEIMKSKEGKIQQGGMGDYTLCVKCNSETGSWYGAKFIDWCYQGMNILSKSGGNPTLFYSQKLYPLAVIKQIASMFFSVNADSFCGANQELVQFVKNKHIRHLSPEYRFFVYYNSEGIFRTVEHSGKIDIFSGKGKFFSEISYPLFGYVMTINSDPPDNRLYEISHFADYEYNDCRRMYLKFPVLPTHLSIPGDYRTKKEIYKQSEKSRRQCAEENIEKKIMDN